jgi:hypothetical protein
MDGYLRRLVGNTHPRTSLELVHSTMETFVKSRTTDVTIARVYYDVLDIALHHGDKARAMVFAEREHNSYLSLEGFDGEKTRQVKAFMEDPTKHVRWRDGNV